jgi:hypothetical protein
MLVRQNDCAGAVHAEFVKDQGLSSRLFCQRC